MHRKAIEGKMRLDAIEAKKMKWLTLRSHGCLSSHQLKAAFPKLWVATQKWVAKFCQVGRQSFSGNIYFLSFICKLDKNTFYLVPLLSKFSIELKSSSKF